VVGGRVMGILDERFRDCICLSICDRIGSMRMLGELVMIKRAKSLERRIR
jgi:hypothetical protein